MLSPNIVWFVCVFTMKIVGFKIGMDRPEFLAGRRDGHKKIGQQSSGGRKDVCVRPNVDPDRSFSKPYGHR